MPPATPATPATANNNLAPGRIDIHSHLLPGVDDGCVDIDESLRTIRQLKKAGYVASICTPHVFPQQFPDNTAAHITTWTTDLQQHVDQAGINYRLLPGGEMRVSDDLVAWLKQHGVPVLADSQYVLSDFWEADFPPWVQRTYEWLLGEGYQPILAHPERLPDAPDVEKNLQRLIDIGVVLQGNMRSFTGEEGYLPDKRVRDYTSRNWYTFLATDVHHPTDLESRLDGGGFFISEFGQAAFDQLTMQHPRELIMGA